MTEPQGDQATEQITAPPKEEAPVKVKDPRRVAAGHALAARNKAAREAKKKRAKPLEPQDSGVGLSFNGVMQVAAVVGAGFTLYHGYQVVKPYLSKRNPSEPYERPVETVYKNPKPATPSPPPPSPAKNEIKGIDME